MYYKTKKNEYGYKKVHGYILTLLIPKGTWVHKIKDADKNEDEHQRKRRAEKVITLSILKAKGTTNSISLKKINNSSHWSGSIIYEIGKETTPFNEFYRPNCSSKSYYLFDNEDDICKSGIHYFSKLEDALSW